MSKSQRPEGRLLADLIAPVGEHEVALFQDFDSTLISSKEPDHSSTNSKPSSVTIETCSNSNSLENNFHPTEVAQDEPFLGLTSKSLGSSDPNICELPKKDRLALYRSNLQLEDDLDDDSAFINTIRMRNQNQFGSSKPQSLTTEPLSTTGQTSFLPIPPSSIVPTNTALLRSPVVSYQPNPNRSELKTLPNFSLDDLSHSSKQKSNINILPPRVLSESVSSQRFIPIMPYMPKMSPYVFPSSTASPLQRAFDAFRKQDLIEQKKHKEKILQLQRQRSIESFFKTTYNETQTFSNHGARGTKNTDQGNGKGKAEYHQHDDSSDSDHEPITSDSYNDSTISSLSRQDKTKVEELLWSVEVLDVDIKSLPWVGIRWRSFFNIDQNCVTLAQVEACSSVFSHPKPLLAFSPNGLVNKLMCKASMRPESQKNCATGQESAMTPTSCIHNCHVLSSAVHIPFISSRFLTNQSLFPQLPPNQSENHGTGTSTSTSTGTGLQDITESRFPGLVPFYDAMMYPINSIYTSSQTFLFGAAQTISLEGVGNRFSYLNPHQSPNNAMKMIPVGCDLLNAASETDLEARQDKSTDNLSQTSIPDDAETEIEAEGHQNSSEGDENPSRLSKEKYCNAINAILHGQYDPPTYGNYVSDYMALTLESIRSLRQEYFLLRSNYAQDVSRLHSDSLQNRNPFRDIPLYVFYSTLLEQCSGKSSMQQHTHHHQQSSDGISETRTRSGSMAIPAQLAPISGSILTSALSDPLSQLHDGVWRAVFAYKELESLIHKDLLRTHASKSFFRLPHIFDMMKRILIIWSLQHSSLGYKQGFNEILAIVVLALRNDQLAGSEDVEINDSILENIAWDDEMLEADAYVLFTRIMRSIAAYYAPLEQASLSSSNIADISASPAAIVMSESVSIKPHSSIRFRMKPSSHHSSVQASSSIAPTNIVGGETSTVPNSNHPNLGVDASPTPFQMSGNHSSTISLVAGGSGALDVNMSDREASQTLLSQKMNYIHHTLLRLADPVLFNALNDAEVLPQVYLLRWFRLLFAREFTFDQTLTVWDHLFSHSQLISLDLQQQRELKEIQKQRKAVNMSQTATFCSHTSSTSTVPPTNHILPASAFIQSESISSQDDSESFRASQLSPGPHFDEPNLIPLVSNFNHDHTNKTYCVLCFEAEIEKLEKMNNMAWEDTEDAGLGIAIDFFALSMILNIRGLIVEDDGSVDPSNALMTLMKYPPVKDIKPIIENACQLYQQSKDGLLGATTEDATFDSMTKDGQVQNSYIMLPNAQHRHNQPRKVHKGIRVFDGFRGIITKNDKVDKVESNEQKNIFSMFRQKHTPQPGATVSVSAVTVSAAPTNSQGIINEDLVISTTNATQSTSSMDSDFESFEPSLSRTSSTASLAEATKEKLVKSGLLVRTKVKVNSRTDSASTSASVSVSASDSKTSIVKMYENQRQLFHKIRTDDGFESLSDENGSVDDVISKTPVQYIASDEDTTNKDNHNDNDNDEKEISSLEVLQDSIGLCDLPNPTVLQTPRRPRADAQLAPSFNSMDNVDADADADIDMSFNETNPRSPHKSKNQNSNSNNGFQTPGMLSPTSATILQSNFILNYFYKTDPDPEEPHFSIRVLPGHIERMYSHFPGSSYRLFAEGYMVKCTDSSMFYTSYKRRWFVLLGFVLIYYKSRSEKVPQHTGFIDLRGRQVTGNEQRLSIEIGPFTGEQPPLSRALDVLRHHLSGGTQLKRSGGHDNHHSDDPLEHNTTELASQMNKITVDMTTGFPVSTMASYIQSFDMERETGANTSASYRTVGVAEAETMILETELALLDTLGLSSQHDATPRKTFKLYAPDHDSWVLWMHLFTNSSYTATDLVSGAAAYEPLPIYKLQDPNAHIIFSSPGNE